MDLNKFLKEIERELELDILKKGETPILDRLQIHLDNLDGDFNLATMLNPKNLKVELYLSMLYQIVYPSKIKKILHIDVDGIQIIGGNNREKLINFIKLVGAKNISHYPKYSHLFHSVNEISHIKSSTFKSIGSDLMFDISFGGAGTINQYAKFTEDINSILTQDIKVHFTSTYKTY